MSDMHGEYSESRDSRVENAPFLNNPECAAPRPELEFQPGERQYWDQLVDKIVEKLQVGEPAAVSLIRCWGKNEQAMGDLADRFFAVQKSFPELLAPMISINGNTEKGDPNHMTTTAVQKARAEKQLPTVTTEVKNYTWTAGLNGPTALLHHLLREKGVTPEHLQKVYILNQSFDVEMDAEMSQKLSEAVKEGDYVFTIREESGMYAQDPEKRRQTGEKMVEALQDPKRVMDSSFALELARIIRNTGMLMPLSDIVEMKGYSNACNKIGGMEDHDLYLRILLSEFESVRSGKDPSSRLEKMLRALKSPLVYNDPAWNKMVAEGKQLPKIEAEANALQTILYTFQEFEEYRTGPKQMDFIFAE